jgi:hypothetical protein
MCRIYQLQFPIRYVRTSNQLEFFVHEIFKSATKLDGFLAVIARNLKKTQKRRKCPMSCKAERLGKNRQDAILLTSLTEDR